MASSADCHQPLTREPTHVTKHTSCRTKRHLTPNSKKRRWGCLQATQRVCAATGCIVLGCIILITFGNHQSTTLTVQDMLQYYER